MAQQKSPQDIDDGQTVDSAGTPRQGVRNLAGIAAIGFLVLLCLVGCGVIALVNLRGAPATVAENPEVTRVVMVTPEVPSAAGRDEENVPLTPEAQPTQPGADVNYVPGEGDLAFELGGTPAIIYTYNVGGPTYALGVTAVVPTDAGNFEVTGDQTAVDAILADDADASGYGPWTRIWQGANEEMFPWTYFFRFQCDQSAEGHLQWHRAVQLKFEGGETGINCTVQIRRDLVSSREITPDPYVAANLKSSPLGLGWFSDGDGTVACDGNTYNIGLGENEISVVQMPFPHDFAGVLEFQVHVDPGHTQYLTQGELLSEESTCTSHLR